jgi:uncharacterized membrane protein
MTLLAFQIQPPNLKGAAVHHLAHALAAMSSRYFVFFISFAVIAAFWLAHHRTFSHIAKADRPLRALNLLFLMTVAALPFPSAVLGLYGSEPVAVVLYAASMAVTGLLLTALLGLAVHRRLLMAGSTREGVAAGVWASGSMSAVFVLSIPVALVAPTIAPYTWLATFPVRWFSRPLGRRLGTPGPAAESQD